MAAARQTTTRCPPKTGAAAGALPAGPPARCSPRCCWGSWRCLCGQPLPHTSFCGAAQSRTLPSSPPVASTLATPCGPRSLLLDHSRQVICQQGMAARGAVANASCENTPGMQQHGTKHGRHAGPGPVSLRSTSRPAQPRSRSPCPPKPQTVHRHRLPMGTRAASPARRARPPRGQPLLRCARPGSAPCDRRQRRCGHRGPTPRACSTAPAAATGRWSAAPWGPHPCGTAR